MSSPTRTILGSVAALVLVAAACTGGSPSSGPGSPQPPTPSPTVPTKIVKGEFELEHVGVVVHLSWSGTEGRLVIDNGSELTLEDPNLYVVTQRSTRLEVEMPETSPLAAGDRERLDLTFPVPLQEMGLTILRFGDETWGVLKPVFEAA